MKTKEIHKIYLKDEKIHLAKGFLGWSVVYPIRNDDGSINWKNLISGGNWFKLIGIGLFVLLVIGAIIEYKTAISIAVECLDKLNQSQILLP